MGLTNIILVFKKAIDSFKQHPKGLTYLFFTELWERFSFYGMRALLTLYMTKELFSKMENNEPFAIEIYAAYGALVYSTPIFGGMIADKILGYRRAVTLGSILMALGHFIMAFEYEQTFYLALGLLIVGNGFFKPNISSLVGSLYEEGDKKRDAGFTIFYMGINIGALISPLLCGWLGEVFGWHWGFGAAGVGMLLGLLIFKRGISAGAFKEHGVSIKTPSSQQNILLYVLSIAVSIGCAYLVLNNFLIEYLLNILLALSVGYLGYILLKVDKVQREKLIVVMFLTLAATTFWAFFEQAGSSLTLYADRNVDLAGVMTASQTNAINPMYIILFALPFSSLWIWLDKNRMNPNTPVKFALGIFQLGLGFLVFSFSGQFADTEGLVPLSFLIIGYLFITTGELFISPVGLSKITELAPKTLTSFMMGVWFLAVAFAHHIAGIIAKLTTSGGTSQDKDPLGMVGILEQITGLSYRQEGLSENMIGLINYTHVFAQIGIIAIGVGGITLLLSPIIKRWMHGVH